MSVTTTLTSISFKYTSGTVYTLPYQYQSPEDVKAIYEEAASGSIELVYGKDYSVDGDVVTVTKQLVEGGTITFHRQTPVMQQTELPPQTITKAIETAIDRNTMCLQELNDVKKSLPIKVGLFFIYLTGF